MSNSVIKQRDPVADNRHYVRVLLREARRRQGTEFAATLLQWAKNARVRVRKERPSQLDLFDR